MDRRDFISSGAAHAQARPKDVLIVANEFGPNSLDIHIVGANRPSYGVSWLVYDRLMTYGKRTLPDGRVTYDRNKLEPERAGAGVPGGFETTLSFDLGGATWRAALLKKDMPMIPNRFGGWLDYPEYFFWCYHGQNAVFNTMCYQNPKLDKLITNARFAENKSIHDASVKEMIQLAYDEVPRVPIFQPSMDVAMQKDVMGYMYWFHLQPDYRQLYKA